MFQCEGIKESIGYISLSDYHPLRGIHSYTDFATAAKAPNGMYDEVYVDSINPMYYLTI